jgi:GR25 family glycosyltransferase involved in LPS biosynthesis
MFEGKSGDILGKETTKLTRELQAAKVHYQRDATLNYSLSFPVYYINMAKSTRRRGRIEEAFGSIWDLHRINAVDGKNATLCESLMGTENYRLVSKLFPEDRIARSAQINPQSQRGRPHLHPSELGAVLSHLTTIRRAYVEGLEKVMIIEDDLSPYLMYVFCIA